ncbi:hypothetical protein P8H26_00625 [Pseudochrobactrum sp. sp1633]|uniref:hypothetical protein n=1 Tax=Pseudochrobactrum sp. sp1633 TaxID=3036706 RepID=UPI0025A58CA5|nr:hypothetical protein [Pseudochrobactrum sp. sp1633]MDM8343895.1 hypothetical protein [Pseudochrobactrum sp. sp1633]HWD11869.1 hypothetical protein [Pseudochrobactrum sp.]
MSDTNPDSNEVFLIIADAWKEGESDPVNVHILLKSEPEEDVIQATLEILANEGFAEAEITEIGTLTEQPEEEPYLSGYNTALSGQVAMIEFDGSHEDDDEDEE